MQVRQYDPGMVAIACYQCALDMCSPHGVWDAAQVLANILEQKCSSDPEEEDVEVWVQFTRRLEVYGDKGIEECATQVCSFQPDEKKATGIYLSEVGVSLMIISSMSLTFIFCTNKTGHVHAGAQATLQDQRGAGGDGG